MLIAIPETVRDITMWQLVICPIRDEASRMLEDAWASKTSPCGDRVGVKNVREICEYSSHSKMP